MSIICWKKKKVNSESFSQSLLEIKKELKNKSFAKTRLSLEERQIVEKIRSSTVKWNLNNVTRTNAYLDFYNRHPEIHWAMLAHLVSRNGGWNMTDLKGEFLPELLTRNEAQSLFSFLERANWLIFQDAFPQLLLYEESLNRQNALFHLLPHLQISTFMEPIWKAFWIHYDSSLLTFALIVNEQNYIEKQLLQDSFYKKEVLQSLEFLLQDILSLNHILFPYNDGDHIRLVGLTVHHFDSLEERISIGKRLYRILFGDKEQLEFCSTWANRNRHRASRKDYWPHLFNDHKEKVPGKVYLPRIKNCQVLSGSPRIYSPKLEQAWKNVEHVEPLLDDWYQNWEVLFDLKDLDEMVNGEVLDEYCSTLSTLELAALAKGAIAAF